jgi:acyl carrier protein
MIGTPEHTAFELKKIIEGLTSIPAGELAGGESIADILAGDSLSWMEFTVAVEHTFGVRMDFDRWCEVDTIASAAAYICGGKVE